MFSLEFRGEVNREETRVMELLCSKSCMILTSTVFDCLTDPPVCQVTDIQTDTRTDRRTGHSI